MTISQEINRIIDACPFVIEEISKRLEKICRNKILNLDSNAINLVVNEKIIEKKIDRLLNGDEVLIPLMRPLALGGTKNNKIQFDFLQKEISKIGISTNIAYLDALPWGRSLMTSDRRQLYKIPFKIAENIFNILNTHCESDYQKDQVLKAFCNYVYYSLMFSRIPCNRIPFVVVANDHTPQLIGFSLAAKDKAIDRLYLQHAAVTDSFPKIDYEISILGNLKSSDVYGVPPTFNGRRKILILPRFPFLKNGNKDYEDILIRDSSSKISICIYLTGSSIESNVFKALDEIFKNPFVSDVKIKPHPNSSYNKNIDRLLNTYKEIVIYDEFLEPHVAIVGNSSVCIQLRSSGIRVYQGFFLDEVSRDYYGFVKDGFCDEVSLNDLSSEFWESWDIEKKNIIRNNYITKKDSEVVKRSQDVLSDFLIKKLSAYEKYINDLVDEEGFLSYMETLRETLKYRESNKVLDDRLNEEWGEKSILLNNPLARKKIVDIFHQCRVSNAYFIMGLAADYESSLGLRIYHKYNKAFWQNIILQDADIVNDLRSIKSIEDQRLKTYSSSSIVKYIFSFKKESFIVENIDFNFLFKNNILNINNVNKIMLAQISLGGLSPDVIDFFENEYSDFDKEKFIFLNLWGRGKGGGRAKIKWHRQINESHLKEITHLVSFLKKDCSCKILSVYERLHKNISSKKIADNFMMRVNDDMKINFFNLLKENIKNKKSFSFIRLSDGEGYIFDNYSFTFDDSCNREMHWWGEELESSRRKLLKDELFSAVIRADAIGLPSVFRLWRDVSKNISTIDASIQFRGIFSVLNGVNSMMERNEFVNLLQVLEEKSNQFLFGNVERVKELVMLSPGVVFISSVKSEVLSEIFSPCEINYIEIPTHARTNGTDDYFVSEKKLPYLYEDIKNHLKDIVRPGWLVLVSAGVLGKILIDYSKALGAVALDVGECVDEYLKDFKLSLLDKKLNEIEG